MFRAAIAASLMPSRCLASARNELPCATMRGVRPAVRSATITSYQYREPIVAVARSRPTLCAGARWSLAETRGASDPRGERHSGRDGDPFARRIEPACRRGAASGAQLPGRLVGPAAAALPYRRPDGPRYAIPVTPDLEAGNTGWCAYPVFAVAGAAAPLPGVGGTCAPATAHSVAIVGGGVPLTNVLNSLSGPRATRPSGAQPSVASLEQAMRDAVWLNFLVVSEQGRCREAGLGRRPRAAA